jgi:Ni/Co efflux regulator RcnB
MMSKKEMNRIVSAAVISAFVAFPIYAKAQEIEINPLDGHTEEHHHYYHHDHDRDYDHHDYDRGGEHDVDHDEVHHVWHHHYPRVVHHHVWHNQMKHHHD